MKKILSTVLLATSLLADFSGSLQVISTYHTDKPTNDSFHVFKEPVRPILTLGYNEYIKDVDVSLAISNRFDDTFLEYASVANSGRRGNHMWKVELGTVDTFQGAFSEKNMATEQNPFIYKNHGMYNDEFLSGFLANTLGTQVSYSYMLNHEYIFTVAGTFSKARELSENKAEGSLYGYNSRYVDLDYSEWIHSLDLKVEYLSHFTLFFNHVEINVGADKTDEVPNDILSRYVAEGDSSIFIGGSQFDITVDRGGFIYCDSNYLFATEAFDMNVVNSGINYELNAIGWFGYFVYYITDDLTPYVSYGTSTNDRADSVRYQEKIAGFRYTIKDDMAILGEFKRSNWLQHETFDQVQRYKNQTQRHIDVASVKFIYTF